MSVWIKYAAPAAIPLAIAANLLRPPPEEDIGAELRSLKVVMPEAQLFTEKSGSPPSYRAHSSTEGELVGLCFTTKDVVPSIVGYAGPIKVMVGMDMAGVITGVAILGHSETPSYVKGLSELWFTEQFKGKPVSDPFEVGQDVDGITRATVTVEAIAFSIREAGRKVAAETLGLQIAGAPSRTSVPWTGLSLLGGILGIAVVGFVTRKHAFRYLALGLAAAVLGFWGSNFLSAVNLSNSLLLRFPPLRSSLVWWVVVGVSVVGAVLFGRVYCGWLCPFGAVEELLGRVKRPKLTLSEPLDTKARYLKYWILWFALILSLLLASSRLSGYEPFATLFNLRGGLINWGLLAAVLLGSLFVFRFWCRYFCPVGAILGLISRLSFFELSPKEKCSECNLCVELCPVRAINSDGEVLKIDAGECIHCNECIIACPRGVLTRARRSSLKDT